MIRVTMQDQGWNVDLFEIFGGVGLRECFDAVVDPVPAENSKSG